MVWHPCEGKPVQTGYGPAAVRGYETAYATVVLPWEGAGVGSSLESEELPTAWMPVGPW